MAFMALELKPVALNHETDTDGRLVYADGRLAALLTRLSEQHEERAGRWFLEFALSPLESGQREFADLDEAESWIRKELTALSKLSEARG
jgi:hypothetical protein